MEKRGELLLALFRYLELCGVDYCAVGDTRAWPRALAGDADIVVGRAELAHIPRLLAAFCRECRVYLVQLLRHERTATYFVMGWIGDSGSPEFLAVDFCSDYLRGGRRLLTAREILERRAPALDSGGAERGFFVPPPHMQFIYYLLKKVDKGELDDPHGEYLAACWRADPDGAWDQVCRFWPRHEDAELIGRAAAEDEWFLVRGVLLRLRRALHRSAPLGVAGLSGELRRRIGRMLKPTGMTVAVLGPDGSGKSSLIGVLLEELAPAFRATHYLHLRPRLLGKRTSAGPATEPHALPARGRLASLAKLGYFFVDYVAGHALRIWPLKCRSTLVIFDRHYRDLAVDARRYRYGGPAGVARRVAGLVPGPDLWLVLDAPAEVAQARKREVAAAETERQRQGYLELAEHLQNSVIVDATPGLRAVATQAATAVLRWLEGRLEYRYPELQFERNPITARLLQHFCRNKTPLLAKFFRTVLNSDIHCRIFSPILMAHPYGIVIHARTLIGRRVVIMQQVTLGGKDRGVDLAPVIEDDVYIGAGAKVLGPVRVGRGAVIGANAVVTRDVPPGCTVVGANRIVRAHDAAGMSGARLENADVVQLRAWQRAGSS